MSLLMVLLTAIIIFAGVFASWAVGTPSQGFYALLLALVTGVYGVFVSLDLFVFFLFYELAVLPMYLLIGIWGSSGEVRPRGIFAWAYRETGVGTKEYAAMKLTLYLLFGSAFILVGIFALYVAAGTGSFSFLELEAASFDPRVQFWVFLAFYVGFGILAGIWPLHTWSPDGHASAPTAVSMLHAGVLMKLGAYGVVRMGMGLLPEAAVELAWLVGGIATAFTVGSLSSLGLPATSGFVAEILTFMGAWRSAHPWWLVPAIAGTFLTAVYVLRVTKQIFWGPPSPHFDHLEDARGPEWLALVLLTGVIVVFGLVPALAIGPVDTATVPILTRMVKP